MASTTDFALDIAGGLPEVIYTSPSTGSGQAGNAYLHLPGVIVAESAAGETRYLLSDGLGSVRQGVDELGAVVAYNEFDPYGNPTLNSELGTGNYGFTGEWWQEDVELLHLRARWYQPGTGTFLSVDPVESEPPYQYVGGNPVNLVDSSGKARAYPPFYSAEVAEVIQTVFLPWLFDSASRHNMPNTGMEDGAFAALILNIIGSEPDSFSQINSPFLVFREQFRDTVVSYFKDKSLGQANIKESTVWALTHGKVRSTNNWEEDNAPWWGGREYFEGCVDYNLKPLPGTLPWEWPYSYEDMLKEQRWEYTIDLVGANIQQGAIYAQRKAPNEKLGPFNFTMWHTSGLMLNDEINDTAEGDGHINRHIWRDVVDATLPVSIQVLADAIPTGYHGTLFRYSHGEAYYNVDKTYP